MHYRLILLFLTSCFIALAQHTKIDRSNYQLLWEITHEDMSEKAYLFGSYHSNDNDVFDFPDQLYTALNRADAIVLETDITAFMLDNSLIAPNISYRKSFLLDWIIPARGADKITYTAYGSDEGRPQFIDMYFKQVADNCYKSFYPLESIEYQIKIGLNNELDPNRPENIELISRSELKELYREGNAKDLHKYTRNSTLEYIDLYKDLIVDRNKVMADGIDSIILKHNTTFIAVGASHLLGPKGIVPLLREKGFTVQLPEITFSDKKSEAEQSLDECSEYIYQDERYDFKIKFSGKPAIKELDNADRLIQYKELGQGNTYSVTVYNYGIEVDIDEYITKYFSNPNINLVHFDTIAYPNQLKAYQGLITHEDGTTEWLRVFKRENILYTLAANGGHRFMNSNRYLNFFNGFEFTNKNTGISLTEEVKSKSETMLLKFPEGYYTEEKILEYDNVWEAKWFNPDNQEFLYAYESIMSDNSISYTNENFGSYILNRYHKDSVELIDQGHQKGAYLHKSYIAQSNGKKIYGKIRKAGNLMQFIEYTGNDLTRKDKFLSQIDTFQAFSPVKNEEPLLIGEHFETVLERDSFKLEVLELKNHEYRTTKNYTYTDSRTSIAYHILLKEFENWAFSEKAMRTLLKDQIKWPDSSSNHEIDTTFYLKGNSPFMEFSIYYPDAENRFKGKVMVNGKSIIIANITYPQIAEKTHKSIQFLDALQPIGEQQVTIHKKNIPLLKNETMINGGGALEDLLMEGHISDSTIDNIIDWPENFWSSFDQDGLLLSSLVNAKNWENNPHELIKLWRDKSTNENTYLTILTLYKLQELKRAKDYMEVIKESNVLNNENINLYKLLAVSQNNNTFLKDVWPVYAEILEDSLAWDISFIIPELMQDEFFEEYFTSPGFVTAVTKDAQPPWAAFRYFEIMHEFGIEKELFLDMLEQWGSNTNDHKLGTIAAWHTIYNERIKRKTKRLIKKDAAIAISYSKVMAVSENAVYDLLSFEQMIGYLAFDHYRDAYFDKDKTLRYIENKTIVGDKSTETFAVYEVIENGKTYYMAKELPKDKKLPSYGGFGNKTYFIYGSTTYQPEQIELKLINTINNRED
ncbi:TraB/GumN family protein [Brumimicrobium aurantiacum]|uniref:TraB/GumN family protein n=1 Tax=Brumimicrobium aurantiacum TaxID=1737063 RepID=A0A3E1F0X3_9FLAO|nr:TraB/GumN family protein [Brumimicrobium aurantiacum]RFC55466.1 TraB/GumN family protein [Brumimicrobium aurantiacum]